MPFQQSQRAVDLMRCLLPEQRRCSRVHLPIRAMVAFREFGVEAQTAFMRDVNMLGAFFYCRQRPSVGHNARLDFVLSEPSEQLKAVCDGLVVRIEEFAPGAAIGVAMEFAHYELARPRKLEQAGQQPENAPFIGWPVEIVERMFEKSGRLMHRHGECEPAA